MKELSLFSGIGGGLLGSYLLGWHPVAAVDFEPYCCEVLARRKKDGIFKKPFDIYCMDVGEFNKRCAYLYRGKVDIITAGFPCQGFSVAGKQLGEKDKRNGWPATIECIRLVRPRYLLLENVPALLTFGYFGTILRELSESGYRYCWKTISAAEVGAPHKRNRLWIVAHLEGERCVFSNQENITQRSNQSNQGLWGYQTPIYLDAIEKGFVGIPTDLPLDEWDAYSLDEIKAIGNAQIPQVVQVAWNLLSEVINNAKQK